MGVPDVAIPIAREVCVLVMRCVKLAEAFYRRKHRPHQEEVADELILPARRQVAIMRGVVSQNDQRVLARADEHDRNQI